MSNKDSFYDKEIAPLLLEAAEKCRDNDIYIVCAVEYEEDKIGRTQILQENAGLAINMIYMCAATAPNFDSYTISLKKYCNKNKVDTGGSIFLSKSFETDG